MKSDALLLTKREELKDAKKRLTDFEKHFNEKMPKQHELWSFVKAAKTAIDGDQFKVNESWTKEEDRLLYAKIWGRHDDADYSILYNTDVDDIWWMGEHWDAFDLYKSYSFLKAKEES